ncbi:hypothetical protein B484DRAFT_401163 [Ochromonadaceae sp. CCMP2298]|nr:hypothetical protein B484DRAFT_401163 [Ochromonadaceae sp. CCMP2298]
MQELKALTASRLAESTGDLTMKIAAANMQDLIVTPLAHDATVAVPDILYSTVAVPPLASTYMAPSQQEQQRAQTELKDRISNLMAQKPKGPNTISDPISLKYDHLKPTTSRQVPTHPQAQTQTQMQGQNIQNMQKIQGRRYRHVEGALSIIPHW